MRVAMWSILNRLARRPVSCSPCSSSSMSRIWRSTRDWLRPDSSTNISLSFPRSPASLAASRSTSPWTWSKARATSPISSEDETPTASTASGRPSLPPRVMRRSASGSRTSASSTAPVRSWRSGRSTDLIKIGSRTTPRRPGRRPRRCRARMAETMAPSCIELTLEWHEALRKASAARMTPAVARTAATPETTASRDRRVRTSQFVFCAP